MKVERALNAPDHVRVQYASEVGLAARKAAYRETTGADALQVTFDAVVETTPARVLEVGCGEGELAERLVREAGAVVTAIDQSPRMVELARARGVTASAADVQGALAPEWAGSRTTWAFEARGGRGRRSALGCCLPVLRGPVC